MKYLLKDKDNYSIADAIIETHGCETSRMIQDVINTVKAEEPSSYDSSSLTKAVLKNGWSITWLYEEIDDDVYW